MLLGFLAFFPKKLNRHNLQTNKKVNKAGTKWVRKTENNLARDPSYRPYMREEKKIELCNFLSAFRFKTNQRKEVLRDRISRMEKSILKRIEESTTMSRKPLVETIETLDPSKRR